MKVIRARVLGFCMGVRRAVELAMIKRSGRVFSPGRLVHNSVVLSDLEKNGIETVDSLSLPLNIEGCSVLIRAHGVSPAVENELRERGARIIDATCPHVKASQLKALSLSAAGRCLFLAGEANHAEIEGVLGYAKDAPLCAVIGDEKEAREAAAALFKKNKTAKTALIGQTTICENEYFNIAEEVKKYFPDLETASTVCNAAKERQNALRDLLEQVEAVIIAGGKESSNTRRLLAIARESGKPCALAEDSGGIPQDFFHYQTVGLSAGASTPDSVIDQIERELTRH